MNSKKIRFIVIIILLTSLVAGIFLIYRIHQNDYNSPKLVLKPGVSHSITAGGVAVPTYLQARAIKAGYYCPSWAAKPGQVSTTICMPLDR